MHIRSRGASRSMFWSDDSFLQEANLDEPVLHFTTYYSITHTHKRGRTHPDHGVYAKNVRVTSRCIKFRDCSLLQYTHGHYRHHYFLLPTNADKTAEMHHG